MKKWWLSFLSCIGVVIASSAWALDRTSLKLHGCDAVDLTTNADGSLVLLACLSPKGFYYSEDFGSTWTYAEGGDYSGGIGKGVAITAAGAFMNFGFGAGSHGIFKSPLPSPGTPWLPTWTRVTEEDNFNPTQFVRGHGAFLIAAFRGISVAGGSGTAALIRTYDPATMAVLGSRALPVTGGRYFANIAFDTDSIYALAISTEFGNSPLLFKATFNGTTGEIGSWADISGNVPLGAGESLSNVVSLPDGRILVAGNSHYISTDAGMSFTVYGSLPSLPVGEPRICRNGSTIVYGNNRSLDGGVTWSLIPVDTPEHLTTFPIRNQICAADPLSAERILLKTHLRLNRTGNFSAGTPTWQNVSTGLDGVDVLYGTTSRLDPARGVFVTPEGVGISSNLQSASPTWLYPVCPEASPCTGGEGRPQLEFDATDSTVFYFINSSGGKIFKGIIGGTADSPTVAWTLVRDAPPEDSHDYFIRQSDVLPGVIIAGSRYAADIPTPVLDGALHFYDAASGSEIRTGLNGKPVSDFIAVNQSLMFAAVRHGFFYTTVENDPEGIYKSTDGGVTWGRVTVPPSIGARLDVSDFTYDSVRDVLYARGVKKDLPLGFVFYLRDASKGRDDWALMPNAGMEGIENSPSTAFSVDPQTGTVYVALFRQVYGTNDFGATWSLFFTGLLSERINSLGFLAAAPSSAVGARATGSSLVSASSIGVQRFSAKLQPPSKGKATCSLKLAKNCIKKSKGKATCTLNGSFFYAPSKKPINTGFRLERATARKAKKWTKVKAGKLGADGKVSVAVARKQRLFYRMKFTKPACTTKIVEVKK